MKNQKEWSLVGIPDHEAVAHLGGRLGAARGPKLFREQFYRFKSKDPVLGSIQDCGDVRGLTSQIEKNHELAIEAVQLAHQKTGLSVVVGGSHDHGFTHLKGIQLAEKKTLGCINIDAHLDVRAPNPQITSGSPFHLAITSQTLEGPNLIEFGIQRHCNAESLWPFIEEHSIQVLMMDELRLGRAVEAFRACLHSLADRCDAIVVSFDLDAVESAHAPGVSAPQIEGFHPSEVLEFMKLAAQQSKVVSLGIFELNPDHDVVNQTARLAATAAFHFIANRMDLRA